MKPLVHRALALFATVATAALACGTAGAETISRSVHVGAVERSYEVDLPPQREPGRALPVVIVFHGGGGAAASARQQTRMSVKGEAEGFIAVYPQGSGGVLGRLRTWNAGTCCGDAMKHRVDEIAFVGALIDDLRATFAIDLARIYATGISNGGMMAYEVACALADRIAAIAVVAGEMTALDRCHPARPVPVLAIHGSADRNLPIQGGPGAKAVAVHDVRSVAAAIDFWRRRDACGDAAEIDPTAPVRRTRYRSCAAGTEVELVVIEGGGHSWPGGERLARFLDAPSPALDATDEIWRFFARH